MTAVPFSRLLRVELRKLVDTRAGFWLLASIGVITVAVVVVFLFAADPDQLTFINFIGATATPQSSCCRCSASSRSPPSGRSAPAW